MKREIGFVSSLGRTTQSSSSCVHLSDDDLNKRFKVTKVIPPSQFEIHAIKQYRRAAQYICFENGKSLLDVLNACRAAPLDSLETTIQSAISGLPVERTFTCKRCKGIFPSICVGKIGPLCNLCAESKESYPTLTIGSSIISRLGAFCLRQHWLQAHQNKFWPWSTSNLLHCLLPHNIILYGRKKESLQKQI
nr:uncharacterized protein LOC118044986 isoform X2 [Populus alba]